MHLTPTAIKVLADLKSGKYNEINNRISFSINCYDSIEEVTRDEVMNAFDELEGAGMIKVYYKGHKATYPYASIDILPAGRMYEFEEKGKKKEERKKRRRSYKREIIIAVIIYIITSLLGVIYAHISEKDKNPSQAGFSQLYAPSKIQELQRM